MSDDPESFEEMLWHAWNEDRRMQSVSDDVIERWRSVRHRHENTIGQKTHLNDLALDALESGDALARELDSGRRRIAELEAALRWYADASNYNADHVPGMPEPDADVPRGYAVEWIHDFGDRARAALGGKS